MKDLTNSKLLASIKEDLNPQDQGENFDTVSTEIQVVLNIEDLVIKLQEYQKKGYDSIKFSSQHNGYQTINCTRHRTPEELIEYRINRVNNKILRWFNDGYRRLNESLKAKEISLQKYQIKVQNTKIVCQSMTAKLQHKQLRVAEYIEAVRKIKEIIDNYPQYTYQELNTLPDKLLPRYNFLD